MTTKTLCLGFPRIGLDRELKRALEGHWSGAISKEELLGRASALRKRHWQLMRSKGIDSIPSNDASLYDHVLDTAVLVGAVPERYLVLSDPVERYFAMARGCQDPSRQIDLPALELTKWFDTNYHYIVPELEPPFAFSLDPSKPLEEIQEARSIGIETRPVFIGPISFLLLSKLGPKAAPGMRTLDALPNLLPVYEALFEKMAQAGVEWIQLDEPFLVTDLDPEKREAYAKAFARLSALSPRPKVLLATYFGPLEDNLELALGSGFEALHLDLLRGRSDFEKAIELAPPNLSLSLGLIDGRNVWRSDLDKAHELLRKAALRLGEERVWVGSSCSLLHVPVDLEAEKKLDPELRSWLAFALQKLEEIRALADAASSDRPDSPPFQASRAASASRKTSPRTHNPEVRKRLASVDESMFQRKAPFKERIQLQKAALGLPLFPTTTIGSFPQDASVRKARAAWKSGQMSTAEYEAFLRNSISECIATQEVIGLDVLVHGEFERTDMVEFFGELLEGFAITENGWVQSYGSRCVKPPILYGDVRRPKPMTVDWAIFAQSRSQRPVKGMLTGPLTMLQWSFVRDDQPRSESCMQIALVLRDEVLDLEKAGIRVIQVDEPALREGLPLRRKGWEEYLRWAVNAFRLTTSGVRNDTQIHTHMCYSEFKDILPAIVHMDADVISIESSRSRMELLNEFRTHAYPNEIGPGVYDVHSPRVPSVEEFTQLIERAAKVIPPEKIWVNPDCGLKTRGWKEVKASLSNMVEAARRMRATYGG
ncbi:MAG: 5-methyltetrahydropteroyltriglutamate--homocysteine S-methyltransferase [Sandaracinaceae bacterium]|nr:5-methyltetrahydropteroyltriglutamate--homocysteine S-methyltransferase [Sandaracinaceae bacterium]